jgi:hypothetical protein
MATAMAGKIHKVKYRFENESFFQVWFEIAEKGQSSTFEKAPLLLNSSISLFSIIFG